MSKTQTNVIVTQYRAEFRAAPFARPRWTVTGPWEHRDWSNRQRRRWTVEREFLAHPGAHSEPARKVPDTGIGHIHEHSLLDMDAVVVFVPTSQASRYGVAVVIEEVER